MNNPLISYVVTALISAGLVGGLSAFVATNAMQYKVDDEIKKRQGIELAFSQAQQTSAENHANALEQLVAKQQEQLNENAKLSQQVFSELKKIAGAANRIEQQIPNAVASDGADYTGLGAHGLQLYREAFGYGDAAFGDFSMPNAAERFTSAPRQATPADLGGAGSPSQARERVWSVEPNPRSKADRTSDVGRKPTQDAE